MRSMIIILFLLHFFKLPVSGGAPVEQDAVALLKFKSTINDVQLKLQSWSNSSINRTCEWRGIKCDESKRVVELDLSSMELSCDVSQLLSSPLSELKNLSLTGNNFTGPIDRLLASLIDPTSCKLDVLDLSGNSLRGRWGGMSSTLNSCKVTLTALNLSRNHLEGDLLGGFDMNNSRLTSLDLSHNSFTGLFQASGDMLKRLHLSNNNFTGLEVLGGGCNKLDQLDISFNLIKDLTNLSLCKSLRILNLTSNQFAGSELFPIQELPLEWLVASQNGFTGSLDRISVPKTLKFLDLSTNNLVIDKNWTLCSSNSELTTLLLSKNNLTGKILESILPCSKLQYLDLSSNSNLSKAIPAQLCTKLPGLQELIISGSNLSGEIPQELTDCSELRVLLLNNNQLSGSIPSEIEKLSKLEWLSLSDNRLTRTIPKTLENLKNLTFLELSNNHLEGDIPLVNFSNILWLDLSSNSLTGSIPPRFGYRGEPKLFPAAVSRIRKMIFMSSPSCSGTGMGRLLLIEKNLGENSNEGAHTGSCKARLYPISSYNLTRPITSAVYLDLSYNKLTGGIPDSLGEALYLTMMSLRNNSLTGNIPSAIGLLKNLLLLDLSHNQFQGSLPSSLCNLTFLSSLNLSYNNLSGMIPQQGQLTTFTSESYEGNPLLCGVPLNNNTCSSRERAPMASPVSSSRAHVIAQQLLVVILVTGIVFLGATAWWIWWKRRSSKSPSKKTGDESMEDSSYRGPEAGDQPIRMTYPEIKQATQNFRFMIGSGGSAHVFRAQLRDGSQIAVKRLVSSLAFHEFLAEIGTLGRLRHPNLVPLLAFCARGEEHFLVYPLMSNGSLENLLSNPAARIPWNMRKRIATDAARGLCFLHHTCVPHIVHRDVTSANVLLDDAWNARLADFGMARLMLDGMSGGKSDYVSVTTLWGTPGYVPPEYYQSFYRCTRGGDVYSFGVILLELLTRKRATGKEEFGESNLVGWVRGRRSKEEVLEVELRNSSGVKEVEEMIGFVRLAMECVEERPHRRPTMLQLVARLKELSIEC